MTIIWNLEKDGDTYSGGEILDPQKGKVIRLRNLARGQESHRSR
jgi:uncharacterized protein (DUF2147 family)